MSVATQLLNASIASGGRRPVAGTSRSPRCTAAFGKAAPKCERRLFADQRRNCFSKPTGQESGLKNIRPYVMNAMRRPSTPLKIMGVISRYLTCTATNTRLSTARIMAARIVSGGCQ